MTLRAVPPVERGMMRAEVQQNPKLGVDDKIIVVATDCAYAVLDETEARALLEWLKEVCK